MSDGADGLSMILFPTIDLFCAVKFTIPRLEAKGPFTLCEGDSEKTVSFGESTILRGVGRDNPELGAKLYYLARFWHQKKLHNKNAFQ